MFVYIVRGYHKITHNSYIVGVYDNEEKARNTVDDCFDADIFGNYGFSFEMFVVV